MLRSLRADYRPARGKAAAWEQRLDPRGSVNGRAGRVLSLASALTFGLVLAIVLIPQFGPWLSAQDLHH